MRFISFRSEQTTISSYTHIPGVHSVIIRPNQYAVFAPEINCAGIEVMIFKKCIIEQ
jgi:hypothetical protein